MTEIKASDIAALRAKCGLGMMECKKALTEAGGDEVKAIEILRKKGAAKAESKSERATTAGIVDCYIHAGNRIGVLIEVLSETDFVAKNEEFKQFVHDIALHIAAMSPKYVKRENVPAEELEKEKELLMEQAKTEGKPAEIAEKIVTGRIEKFYSEICLLDQPYVKDQETTVGELLTSKIQKIGENLVISRFTRFEIGA